MRGADGIVWIGLFNLIMAFRGIILIMDYRVDFCDLFSILDRLVHKNELYAGTDFGAIYKLVTGK